MPTAPGVLELDVPAIEAVNRVDPLITLATLPAFARTRARGMVATVKIIAYGVDRGGGGAGSGAGARPRCGCARWCCARRC